MSTRSVGEIMGLVRGQTCQEQLDSQELGGDNQRSVSKRVHTISMAHMQPQED